MSWSTPDPYCQPEAFNLEIYATCGSGGGYDWDVFIVWVSTQEGDNSVYYWSGSGCSCYGPCDDITKIEELGKATSLSSLIDELEVWYRPGVCYANEAELVEFKAKLAELRF